MKRRLKLAVLISGGGTTLKNLIDRNDRGQVDVDFRLVLSSTPAAGGLAHAAQAKIPTQIVRKRDFSTPEEYSQAVFDCCRAAEVDYVLMGGFLSHVLIPHDFNNRVLNTHPSLIPSFCGKGFYGLRVHQAVLDYGAKVTGCTIHFVDNEYDHGPIIEQRALAVSQEDDASSLARRVFALECEAYPAVLNLLGEGRVQVQGRRVVIHDQASAD